MRKAYILAGVIAYSLMGCHDHKLAPKGEAAPLSDKQMDQIRVINSAQADTLAAAGAAFASEPSESKPAPAGPGDLEKIAKKLKIMKLLKDGACTNTSVPVPVERFDQPWYGVWQVAGGTCPMELNERSEFNLTNKKWTMSRTLAFKTDEIREAAGLDQLAVQGSLARATINGNVIVAGSVTYANFKVAGVGLVSAKIEVTPEEVDGGQVKLTLDNGIFTAVGRIRWVGSKYALFANSDVVDAKTFAELFSSFQLLEIMDRAQKMK